MSTLVLALPAERGLKAGGLGNGVRKDRKLLTLSRNASLFWDQGRRRGKIGKSAPPAGLPSWLLCL